jgi:hypothetical protein
MVAVYRDGEANDTTWFSIYVVTALHTKKNPTRALYDTNQFLA